MTKLPPFCEPPYGTAIHAAESLLSIGHERGDTLNHRQLQNLLYYAQGLCIATTQTLLFTEAIEIREDGPVVSVVAQQFSYHGEKPIPVLNDSQPHTRAVYPGVLLGSTHLEFKDVAASQLTRWLMSESPWQEACRNGTVVDPRIIAKWWCDRIDVERRNRKPRVPVKLRDYLNDHPEIAERFRQPHDPTDMIPLR